MAVLSSWRLVKIARPPMEPCGFLGAEQRAYPIRRRALQRSPGYALVCALMRGAYPDSFVFTRTDGDLL